MADEAQNIDSTAASRDPTKAANTKRRRKNATRACDRCKDKKTKCDGTKPCIRCTTNREACTYDKPYLRGTLPTVRPARSTSIVRRSTSPDPFLSPLPSPYPSSPLYSPSATSPFPKPAVHRTYTSPPPPSSYRPRRATVESTPYPTLHPTTTHDLPRSANPNLNRRSWLPDEHTHYGGGGGAAAAAAVQYARHDHPAAYGGGGSYTHSTGGTVPQYYGIQYPQATEGGVEHGAGDGAGPAEFYGGVTAPQQLATSSPGMDPAGGYFYGWPGAGASY